MNRLGMLVKFEEKIFEGIIGVRIKGKYGGRCAEN